ncbi:MAG: hypothetical protein GXN93_02990 [Candidatus Diapherotrites archaeon]|nr:hypothetical protein [Candidatus Diapherotrites archaeon]
MEPVIITFLYILAMYGMTQGANGLILVLISAIVMFFMSRDYFVPFLISTGVIWLMRALIPEPATWGALGLALAMLTMVITGAIGERKKKEDEIPPEMLPYLMAMYENQPPGGYR